MGLLRKFKIRMGGKGWKVWWGVLLIGGVMIGGIYVWRRWAERSICRGEWCIQERKQGNKSVVRIFTKDGRRLIEEEYEGGVKDGKGCYFYYDNGVMAESLQYQNGKLHGDAYTYDRRGTLVKMRRYYYDTLRSGIVYWDNGQPMQYVACDYKGEVKFMIEYDSAGKPLKGSVAPGELILDWRWEKKYPVGKEVQVEVLVPNPPGCSCVVEVYVKKDGKRVDDIIIGVLGWLLPDNFNRIGYKKEVPEFDEEVLLAHNVLLGCPPGIRLENYLVLRMKKDGKSSYKITDKEGRVLMTDEEESLKRRNRGMGKENR